MTIFVFTITYACNKMCHDFSTPYCFMQRTMTMFIFATYNYDSKKTTKNNNGVMIVPHLIVSCRKLWLCSSLQLIMPVKKCHGCFTPNCFLQRIMTMFVFATNYARHKMCHSCSTPYCLLQRTMTMFVFATNYACAKMCRGCSTPYCFLKNLCL